MLLNSIELKSFIGVKAPDGSSNFSTAIPNDVAIFVGKNGCGKSILLEQLAYSIQNNVSVGLSIVRNGMDLYGNQFTPVEAAFHFDYQSIQFKFDSSTKGNISISVPKSNPDQNTHKGIVLYIPPSRDISKPPTRMEKIDFPLQSRLSVFDRNSGIKFEQTLVSIGSRHIQAAHHGLGRVPETDILERITKAYKVMFPDITLVGTYGHEFLAKKDGATFSISSLSHGEKQALILFSFVAKEPNLTNSILIVDEPDIGLSKELRKKLIPSLRSMSPSLQIIMATHSPEIIESVGVEKVIPLTN